MVRRLMAFVRALATYAAIVALVVVGMQKASTHPTWGPMLKPYLEVLSAAVSPTPTSGGVAAARERQLVKVEKVSKDVETAKDHKNEMPPDFEGKMEVLPPRVVEIPSVPITVCSPGGAFFVPEEVFEDRAVCDDPSLGVPLQEAREKKLTREQIRARLDAIRQRYLAEKQQHKN